MEKIPMKIFMGIILVIGLALIVCSFLISGSVTECNVKVQNALRGLLVMGVALFTVSATILALNCNEKSASGIALIVILFLLSTITIGLISTIYQCDDTKKDNGTILNVMLIMSIFVTLGSFAYIVYQIIQRVKKGKKSSNGTGGIELGHKGGDEGDHLSPSSDFGG